VFYEDFTDEWRRPANVRYPQRIDVDEWRHYVPDGVQVKGLIAVPLNERRKAVFEIPKEFFRIIETELSRHNEQPSGEGEEGADDSAVEVLEKSHAKGQGFLLDSKLRKALEKYAMDAAIRCFESQGYEVEDHSKNHPYDLRCSGKEGPLYVEVKGTQTNGSSIFLTSGEVTFARCHKEQMGLFLLHSIRASADGKVLTKGEKHLIVPWEVDCGCLEPVSYKYEVPKLKKTSESKRNAKRRR
jgi:Domain of unknown function (DUF3883)